MNYAVFLVAGTLAMAMAACARIGATDSSLTTMERGVLMSGPINVNGAEFQGIADAVWRVPEPGAESDINLGIRITNRRDTELRFKLFDTLRLVLISPQGKSLLYDGGRDGTKAGETVSRPLAPGESLTISRRAQLKWIRNGQSLRLIGSDDFGGIWYFDNLGPGTFELSFEYENKTRGPDNAPPIWIGEVRTSPLKVEIK